MVEGTSEGEPLKVLHEAVALSINPDQHRERQGIVRSGPEGSRRRVVPEQARAREIWCRALGWSQAFQGLGDPSQDGF